MAPRLTPRSRLVVYIVLYDGTPNSHMPVELVLVSLRLEHICCKDAHIRAQQEPTLSSCPMDPGSGYSAGQDLQLDLPAALLMRAARNRLLACVILANQCCRPLTKVCDSPAMPCSLHQQSTPLELPSKVCCRLGQHCLVVVTSQLVASTGCTSSGGAAGCKAGCGLCLAVLGASCRAWAGTVPPLYSFPQLPGCHSPTPGLYTDHCHTWDTSLSQTRPTKLRDSALQHPCCARPSCLQHCRAGPKLMAPYPGNMIQDHSRHLGRTCHSQTGVHL